MSPHNITSQPLYNQFPAMKRIRRGGPFGLIPRIHRLEKEFDVSGIVTAPATQSCYHSAMVMRNLNRHTLPDVTPLK